MRGRANLEAREGGSAGPNDGAWRGSEREEWKGRRLHGLEYASPMPESSGFNRVTMLLRNEMRSCTYCAPLIEAMSEDQVATPLWKFSEPGKSLDGKITIVF